MIHDLDVIHFTLEGALAGLAGMLFRRLDAARRQIVALETAQGAIRRRFEAATAGLHTRLLTVERASKQLHTVSNANASPARRPAPELLRGGGALAAKTQLSRGEMELLTKVRQLSGGGR